MPTLDWIGKDKVINHHLEVPYRVLNRVYSYDVNGQHEEDNGSENMIIHGDNLEALKSLLPHYEGRIDCIYIDPPYNTGKEGWVYNDNLKDPRIVKWLGEVVGNEGEDLSRHDKWLCMIYPRLKLLHKLLSEKGVIFISIDDNEQAHLKIICDEIFGSENCIGPIIQDKQNAKSDTINIQKNHEFILVYRKTKITENGKIKPSLINHEKTEKKVFSENGRYYYLKDSITTRGEGGILNARENLGYTVYYNPNTLDKIAICDYDVERAKTSNDSNELYTDNEEYINKGYIPIRPPKVRGLLGSWTWDINKFNAEKDDIVITGKPGAYAVKKRVFVSENDIYKKGNSYYISFYENKNSKSILQYSTNDGTKKLSDIMGEKGVFNNPKNIDMLKYLIGLIPNKNIVVLDSFAGSGATGNAVIELNKEDNGGRSFILIEMEDYADTKTAERVKRVIQGYDTEKGDHIDGIPNNFTYYELGEPLMVGDSINENIPVQNIREYIFFTETKLPVSHSELDNEYHLGTQFGCAYYFYYEKNQLTTLNRDFLKSIKTKADSYVIYADVCTLGDSELEKYHITFKKIPRDITRF